MEEQTETLYRRTQEMMGQARRIEEEVQRTADAKAEVERQWKEGKQPVVEPTDEERQAMKKRIGYQEGHFHIAVAGVAASGKTSLINALRGVRNKESNAATMVPPTTDSTTLVVYPAFQLPDTRLYELPGAGTLDMPEWQYFNAQGLYAFDAIILLFDTRFTATDIAILSNAKRFDIPTYITRSKADQHIRNIMQDIGYDSDTDDEIGSDSRLYDKARSLFTTETQRSVESNLMSAGLATQPAYVVSSRALLSIVKGKKSKRILDEQKLLGVLELARLELGDRASLELWHTQQEGTTERSGTAGDVAEGVESCLRIPSRREEIVAAFGDCAQP